MCEKEQSEDDAYAIERSIEIDRDRLDSVRRSIENERQKAGILIGFIVIALIEGASRLERLGYFSRILIVLSFFVSAIFALESFRSSSMKNSIKTEKFFQKHWERKEFLRDWHNKMTDIIDSQKEILSRICKDMTYALYCVGISVLLIGITIIA